MAKSSSSTKSPTCPGSLFEDPVDILCSLTSSSHSTEPDPCPQAASPRSIPLSSASPPAPQPLSPSHLGPSHGSLLQGEAEAAELGTIQFSRPPSPGPFPEPLPHYKLQPRAFTTCIECQARLDREHHIEQPWTELDPYDFRYEHHHTLDDRHNAADSEVCASQGKKISKPSNEFKQTSSQSNQYSIHSIHNKDKDIDAYSPHDFRHERSPSPVCRKRIGLIISPSYRQAKIPLEMEGGGSREDVPSLSDLLTILRSKEETVFDSETITPLLRLLYSRDYSRVPSRIKDTLDAKILMEPILFLFDHNFPFDTDALCFRAGHLLIKLGIEKEVIPNSLKLDPNDVTIDPRSFAFESGGFANVYKGKYRGREVALKRIRASQMDKNFCREVLAWRILSHKYILPFMGVYIDHSGQFVSIVSPYMKNGTLSDWRKGGTPSIAEVQNYMLAVAECLQYAHGKGMIHGDLRGNNILLDDNLEIKIGDFGLTRHSDGTGTQDQAMSVQFAAPEMFRTGDDEGIQLIKRTERTDTYAFGCLYYETHFGRKPFGNKTDFCVVMRVVGGHRPPRLSDPPLDDRAWQLIVRCWHQDPVQRPVMVEVVQIMESWL